MREERRHPVTVGVGQDKLAPTSGGVSVRYDVPSTVVNCKVLIKP